MCTLVLELIQSDYKTIKIYNLFFIFCMQRKLASVSVMYLLLFTLLVVVSGQDQQAGLADQQAALAYLTNRLEAVEAANTEMRREMAGLQSRPAAPVLYSCGAQRDFYGNEATVVYNKVYHALSVRATRQH